MRSRFFSSRVKENYTNGEGMGKRIRTPLKLLWFVSIGEVIALIFVLCNDGFANL